ncbi:MAG: hypothetical protein HQL58_06740, partial [Magnetococcales bacterium]|nr:hypothetical protein [Magnetococcales bacterium]
ASSTLWRQVAWLSDDKLEEQIRSDQIDILVDLSGYTAYNRLSVFARKPAPIQVTWAGWVGTTGMRAMDWLIADRFHVVADAGEEDWYTEKIFYMPHSYVAYQLADHTPNFSSLPYRRNGYITFGCYNNVSKLNPATIAAWGRILTALPTSRLLLRSKRLTDPGVHHHFLTLLQQYGVAPQRVQLLGELEHLALMTSYSEIDIALDTWPYSGGVTTLEALWMGVPVITRTGHTFAGRHTTSYLNMIGHGHLVTDSMEHYIQRAVDLGSHPDQIETLRHCLRADIKKSPLLRHADFARALEEGYRMMWREFCATGGPNGTERPQPVS